MLPSRGLLRTSPNVGIAQLGFRSSNAIARPGAATRQFGTALRSHASVLRSSRRAVTGLSVPMTATATLSAMRLPSSMRFASTQPPASAPVPPPGAEVIPPPTGAEITSASDLGSSLDGLTGSELLNISEQSGFLKTLGLDYGWGPTSMMEWVTETVYLTTGMPWWATISTVALIIRLALLKPSIDAAQHQGKLQQLNRDPRYATVVQQFKDAAFGARKDQSAMMTARQEKSRMERKVGLKQWKMFVPMIQLPLAIGMFRLFKDMAALPVPSLEFGGLAWFTDLTIPDPYFALPILGSVLFYQVLKIGAPYLPETQAKMMGMIGIVMIPISMLVTAWLPAAVQLYILISGGMQLGQTWLLQQSGIRRMLNLVPLVPAARTNATTAASGSWQPPRTIATTAHTVPTATTSENPLTTLKSGVSSVREKVGDYASKKAKEGELAKAQKYEEKRALQEKEQYYVRRQEAIAKKADRRRRQQ